MPGSHESVTRQPRNMTKGGTGTKHTRETFQTTQQACITRVIDGVIPSEPSFSEGFESSRDVVEVVEVDVLEAVVVEVVVHVAKRK